jgi:hypothetical protein
MARFLREARGCAKSRSRANRHEVITRDKSNPTMFTVMLRRPRAARPSKDAAEHSQAVAIQGSALSRRAPQGDGTKN